MKTAFVCDWLTGMRGGERCLEAVCELYPDADIFTLVHYRGAVSEIIESHKIYTSYIQRLPGNSKTFRRYLPLFGNAMQSFDLSGYDLVVSFSHCVAKSVRVSVGIPHICYCYTPMRYAWYMRNDYLNTFHGPKRWIAEILLNHLRKLDRKTSERVTHFIAISKNVQKRIKEVYNKNSEVIYPPVDIKRFNISKQDQGYYLIVSALVPYKRIDLAISAFSGLDRKLLIVGNGPEEKRLKNMASKNVSFVDFAGDNEVAKYMENCRALIFPGEEDFGIVPLEAQACGKPIIAYAKGGVLETVNGRGHTSQENATGIFFYNQNPLDLRKAIIYFEEIKEKFNPIACRNNALRFDRPIYKQLMQKYIQTAATVSKIDFQACRS